MKIYEFTGAPNPRRVRVFLAEKGINDVLVFAGGIIPDEDIPALQACGIQAVFQPGTNTDDVVAFIHADLAAAAQ